MIAIVGLTASGGKIEYDEPTERYRTPYTVGKAIKAAIVRAKIARSEAECWPSDWLKVIEALSGEKQWRPGFKLTEPFLDWLFVKMTGIDRLNWNLLTIDELESILLSLDADELPPAKVCTKLARSNIGKAFHPPF